jgi:hypothetical protein
MVWEPLTKPRRGRAAVTIESLACHLTLFQNVVYSTSEVYLSAKVRHKAGEGKFLKMLRNDIVSYVPNFNLLNL